MEWPSLVSSMMRVDSDRFCSYTFVPATSLSRFRRSLSDMFVRWVICGQQDDGLEAHSSLWNNVIRVAPGKARTFEEIEDFGFGDTLAVKRVLVFLETNGATEVHFWQ